MLAYVFWHWRNDRVSREEYETDLRRFHQTLASNRSAGFNGSTVFSIEGAEWLDAPGTAYEEWYLLDDSAAMDPLNHAAVHDACEEPHNRVARNAAGGTGGLYRLRIGTENLAQAKFATWLSKPEKLSYGDFYEALKSSATQQGFALWGRQMTLGPTAEFCIHNQTQTTLTPEYKSKTYALNLIWTNRD
jgi:hypothetical protein